MQNHSDTFPLRRSQTLITAASYALVCGMLMMATLTVVQAGAALAPDWRAGAWVWLSPLLALEALLSARYLRRSIPLTPEWVAYRVAEWITILLILRLVLYASTGIGALRTDLNLPWREFAANFFNGAYLAWIVLGFFIWLIAGEFAATLEPLEVDEQTVELEREARSGAERQEARTRLASLILTVGGILALAASLLRQDWLERLGGIPPLTTGALNLVIYFVLGLVLLSLTQFSTLAMRWGITEYPVRADVARHWLLYGMAFLGILGGVALMLPTAYASGLLRILMVVISYLLIAISFLFFLLSLPILLALNSLSKIAGEEPVAPTPAWSPPDPLDSLLPASRPSGEFSEFLLALLFWFVFLGVIFFAVRYYFSQQAGALEALKRVPILGHLLRLGYSVWSWLRGARRELGAALQEGVHALRERLGARRQVTPPGLPGYVSLRRLSPRQQIIFFYGAYLRRTRQHGLPRHPAQTPEEYAGTLEAQLPEVAGDLQGLTGQFEEARYSQHEINPGQVSTVQGYWARIKGALRRYRSV